MSVLLSSSPNTPAKVAASECSAHRATEWWLVRVGGRRYRLISALTGSSLGFDGDRIELVNAKPDATWMFYGTDSPTLGGADEFEIRTPDRRRCLTSKAIEGTDPTTLLGSCKSEQRLWKLEPDLEPEVQVLAEHSNHCFDVRQADDEVQQYDCHGLTNQAFFFEPRRSMNGKDAYAIRVASSRQCLATKDYYSPGWTPVIVQAPCSDSPAQRWHIEHAGNDRFQIQSEQSGSCLDVAGGSLASQARIQQFACRGSLNQRFRIGRTREKRLVFYRVARSDGSRRALWNADDIVEEVELAKAAFAWTGVRFDFQVGRDVIDVDADALSHLGESGAWHCRGSAAMTPVACANAIAAELRGTLAVFASLGGGAHLGMRDFVSLGKPRVSGSTSCDGLPDGQLARELGRYFGLSDAHRSFSSKLDADSALSDGSGDFTVFDGDALNDTLPIPYWGESDLVCESAAPDTGYVVVGFNGALHRIDGDNVMSPYRTRDRVLSPAQGAIVRALLFTRDWQF